MYGYKIDLEKAYDRLEWSFIYKILRVFRFPQNIIKLIMSCVSSTSISILVNGGKLDPLLHPVASGRVTPYPVLIHTLHGIFRLPN